MKELPHQSHDTKQGTGGYNGMIIIIDNGVHRTSWINLQCNVYNTVSIQMFYEC
jgi:hypothetical protein